MEFVQRCAASAGMSLTDPHVEVDQRGLQNLVLIDHSRQLVARFPRSRDRCAAVADAAARLQALHPYAVPVPEVLDCVTGGPGRAHLLLGYLPGEPLDCVATDSLPPAVRSRLVSELRAVTDVLHSVPAAVWPSPAPAWVSLWGDLRGQVATCPSLNADQRERLLPLADAAVDVARRARIGVFHGDLGGVNCRIDPATGRVLAILDWDSASIGDVATDLVAVMYGVGPLTSAELRDTDPLWDAAWTDYRAYLATWPIQAYLWSLREGAERDREECLAELERAPHLMT